MTFTAYTIPSSSTINGLPESPWMKRWNVNPRFFHLKLRICKIRIEHNILSKEISWIIIWFLSVMKNRIRTTRAANAILCTLNTIYHFACNLLKNKEAMSFHHSIWSISALYFIERYIQRKDRGHNLTYTYDRSLLFEFV